MMWTVRIVEATRWHGDPGDAGWEQVETALGTALPSDFKELCRRFGPGVFSAYLALFRQGDGQGSMPLLGSLRFLQDMTRQDEAIARMYEPYGIFDPAKGSGLIQWGLDQTEGEYFWLADRSVDPDRWPVIARSEGSEPWDRFDMSTAEVVYRVIADHLAGNAPGIGTVCSTPGRGPRRTGPSSHGRCGTSSDTNSVHPAHVSSGGASAPWLST